MDYEEGQDVVIRRNLGIANGREKSQYYYGGSIRKVPLGSKGVIESVSKTSIYVKLQNGTEWSLHPDELRTNKEHEEAEKKRQKIIDSKLEEILQVAEPKTEEEIITDREAIKENTGNRTEYQKETHTGIVSKILNYFRKSRTEVASNAGNPFKPEFNPREEYAVWLKKEFPELDTYARRGEKYIALIERKEEVLGGAKKAYRHAMDTTTDCVKRNFADKYNALVESSKTNYFTRSTNDFLKYIIYVSYNLNNGREERHYGTAIMD